MAKPSCLLGEDEVREPVCSEFFFFVASTLVGFVAGTSSPWLRTCCSFFSLRQFQLCDDGYKPNRLIFKYLIYTIILRSLVVRVKRIGSILDLAS